MQKVSLRSILHREDILATICQSPDDVRNIHHPVDVEVSTHSNVGRTLTRTSGRDVDGLPLAVGLVHTNTTSHRYPKE